MFKNFKGLLFGVLLAACGAAGAQNADVGFSPTTNLQGFPGLDIALGTPPVVTGCNTSPPLVVGGATTGRITTVGTTTGCAIVLTYTLPKLLAGQAAPTLSGLFCWVSDLTTVADLFTQASTAYTAPTATAKGTISCTFTSRTIASADVLLYAVQGF